MGRVPRCSNSGLNQGAWTADEDNLLLKYFETHSELRGWKSVPKKAGLRRSEKSCRLRWLNYLRPNIKRGNISPEEEDLIIRLHSLLGNRWALIAGRVPGRTDNEIKNYWNGTLSKKLSLQGIDPKTHKPFVDMNILLHKYSNCKQLQSSTLLTELLQHRGSLSIEKDLESPSVVESDTDAESHSVIEQLPVVSTELSLSYNPGPDGILSHLMNTQPDGRPPRQTTYASGMPTSAPSHQMQCSRDTITEERNQNMTRVAGRHWLV